MCEMPSTEDDNGFEEDIIAKRGNDSSRDFTLSFVIEWTPEARTLALHHDPEPIEDGSNLTIQGKIATSVKLREGTALREEDALLRMLPAAIDSQSSQQNGTAGAFNAIYHPDDHTTVAVIAPAHKWADSDFKEMLESIEIALQPSSSAWPYSYQPTPSRERWRCSWPYLRDYKCS